MRIKNCVLLLSSIFTLSFYPLHAHKEADYVIVGVGTAGAVVARKLSDNKKTSVIALHAGSDFTDTPLIKLSSNSVLTVPGTLGGPPLAETGVTIPQPNADDRQLDWVMALPEGGATSINGAAWCKGTRELYSKWEKIAGKKWSAKRIFHLYKQLEHYHGNTKDKDSHGYHGLISVRQVPHPSKVSKVFTKATIRATSFPFVLDYNDPETPIGVSSQIQYTQSGHDGKNRVTSATAFLGKDVVTKNGFGVDGRKLRILFNSIGLKVLWKGKKAIGVKYYQHGKRKKVYAKKGVVVCAGLKSSSFLMHSGVGPQGLLNSLKIPVKFDNPNVGQGLADQPAVRMIFKSNPNDISLDPNGLFTQIAWLPTPGENKKKRTLRIATITTVPGTTILTLDLCQPKSRGSITITKRSPLAPPVIDLGTLTNQSDLVTLRKGMQVYIKRLNKSLKHIDPQYRLLVPDPAILDDATLVDDYIKGVISSNMHFQSHCRMAAPNNGGVVNSKGYVYGVEKLIVADNSVAPLCMDGSPMASAYLIGANIAQMLTEKN